MENINYAAELFHKGGLVMYPLLACSVIVFAIAIERRLYLSSAKTDLAVLLPQLEHNLKIGDWAATLKITADSKGAAAAMLFQVFSGSGPVQDCRQLEQMLEAAAVRTAAKLRRRITYLDTIVTLAPLLGLLGTVNGMIHSFSILNITAGQPLAITGGVGEALIATAAGLCVAIVALVFHSYLNHCVETVISDMEEAANAVVTAVMRGGRETT